MVHLDGERDDDRVLVRPYVPEAEPAEPPETPGRDLAPVTIDGDLPTEILPLPGPPTPLAPDPPSGPLPGDRAGRTSREVKDRQMVVWLVGSGLALVLLAAIVMIALWPRGDDEPQQAASGPPAMQVGTGTDTAAGGPAAGSAKPSVSPSASSSTPPTKPSASAAQRPSAAADRSGTVRNGSGQCLDGVSATGEPGTSVIARSCDGSAAQRWTAASDGTLRIAAACASGAGGGVRLAPCTGDSSQRWRAGPDGSLVNAGSGLCLTDPRNGTRGGGGRVRLATCEDNGQRWSLP